MHGGLRWCMLLAILMMGLGAYGQRSVLIIEADTTLPRAWKGPFKVDSATVKQQTAEVRNAMIAKGFLAANCDSCTYQNDTTICRFYLGRQFRWARLSAGGVPKEIASAARFRERFYTERPITPRQVAKLFNNLISECENNGFPFASVRLDSMIFADQGLNATIRLEKGPFTQIDSVVVRGTARITTRYLQSYVGIRPGDPYNEALITKVDDRVRELPFVTAKHPAYLLFSPEQTKLYLFLDSKRASNFNGIIGLGQDPGTGKLQFTGDLELKLRNALHRGEAIDLKWRSLQDRSQDLKLGFNYPFLLNTPFGVDLGLKIFKRDTSFLEVASRGGLEYLLGMGDKVQLFVNHKNSSRLGRKTAPTPGMADVRLTAYGLGLYRERFDYRFNPREGLALDLEGSVGRKRSNTATFADTVRTTRKSTQYELAGAIAWHLPLGRRATIRLAGQGGTMVNEQLYSNELYRIGGNKSLRGADEAAIFASSFAIATLEYRFLFEENSNFFVFVDQGWWEDQSREHLLTDTPIGFGIGTSFETKAGIFSLSYALGKQFNNPVELRNGKVHFGFTSLF